MKTTEELHALAEWLNKNSDANTIANVSGPLLAIARQVGALETELKVERKTAELFLSQRIAIEELVGGLAPKHRVFLDHLMKELRSMVEYAEREKRPLGITGAGKAALQHVQDRLERSIESLKVVLGLTETEVR